jgi:uncharacterized protein
MTRSLLWIGCFAVILTATSCGSDGAPTGPKAKSSAPTSSTAQAEAFTTTEVTFPANGLETSGTLTTPPGPGKHPAVLFIAGSGPTDRNGDTPLIAGSISTLKFLAESIAPDAVTLRFDKLGVGKSQLPANPAAISLDDFTNQAEAALKWLATQPTVDAAHITVAGHSEGGLIALKLGAAKNSRLHSLALFSPPGARYLAVIRSQLANQVTAETLTQFDLLATELRSNGTIKSSPTDPVLATIFTPNSTGFLANAETYDPVSLASSLPKKEGVLLSCGERDLQVPCASLTDLRAAVKNRIGELFTDTTLVGTNHVLRVSGTQPGGPQTYVDPALPHSAEAAAALRSVVLGR